MSWKNVLCQGIMKLPGRGRERMWFLTCCALGKAGEGDRTPHPNWDTCPNVSKEGEENIL
jgi:hypothetical protein